MINKRLIILRKQKGLSQKQLADKIGVSRQALSKWEKGITDPELKVAREIALFFDVTIDSLFEDKKAVKVNEDENKHNFVSKEIYGNKKGNLLVSHSKLELFDIFEGEEWIMLRYRTVRHFIMVPKSEIKELSHELYNLIMNNIPNKK